MYLFAQSPLCCFLSKLLALSTSSVHSLSVLYARSSSILSYIRDRWSLATHFWWMNEWMNECDVHQWAVKTPPSDKDWNFSDRAARTYIHTLYPSIFDYNLSHESHVGPMWMTKTRLNWSDEIYVPEQTLDPSLSLILGVRGGGKEDKGGWKGWLKAHSYIVLRTKLVAWTQQRERRCSAS